MSEVVIQSLAIIIPIAALVLGLHYFHTKQMNALEDRLREYAKDSENRLREDMRESEDRLRDEIKAVAESVETAKFELRAEIAAVARSVEKGDSDLAESVETAKSELRTEIAAVARSVETTRSELNHRIDRVDDKVSRLIQDVGVVQGALLGVSVGEGSREQEPAPTS